MRQQGVDEAMGIRTERQAEEAAVGVAAVPESLRSAGVGVTESNFTEGSRADRASTTGSVENDLFYESDSRLLYRWDGVQWLYVTGIYAASNAARLALTITTNDNGVLFFATDTGALWEVAAGAWVARVFGVAGGGTGATTASAARTNLGIDPVATLKSKLNATVAPAVVDDSAAGYAVGSQWINVTAGDAYVCVDASVGAAVWKKTTP
jgi:hypothetical protein